MPKINFPILDVARQWEKGGESNKTRKNAEIEGEKGEIWAEQKEKRKLYGAPGDSPKSGNVERFRTLEILRAFRSPVRHHLDSGFAYYNIHECTGRGVPPSTA